MLDNELRRYIEQLSLPGMGLPPLSNRGAIDTGHILVFSHLDYLSIMYPYPDRSPKSVFARLPLPEDLFEVGPVERGVQDWRSSAAMLPAGRFYWNEGERDKGSYAVFAGDDLALLRSRTKLTDDELLIKLMWNARNVTRLDFCINITSGLVGETRDEFEAGRAVTRVRTAWEPDFFGGGSGRTIYFGSRSSFKMLRVYDKARELKLLSDVVLNRIELQVRKKPADMLARKMRNVTVIDTGKSAIRDFCDFPDLGWYQDALSGAKDVAMQLTPAKSADFMTWLNEQVGPSIIKRLGAGQHTDEIRDWIYELWEHVRLGGVPPQDEQNRQQ